MPPLFHHNQQKTGKKLVNHNLLPNQSLKEIASAIPTTMDELSQIAGIGTELPLCGWCTYTHHDLTPLSEQRAGTMRLKQLGSGLLNVVQQFLRDTGVRPRGSFRAVSVRQGGDPSGSSSSSSKSSATKKEQATAFAASRSTPAPAAAAAARRATGGASASASSGVGGHTGKPAGGTSPEVITISDTPPSRPAAKQVPPSEADDFEVGRTPFTSRRAGNRPVMQPRRSSSSSNMKKRKSMQQLSSYKYQGKRTAPPAAPASGASGFSYNIADQI